MAVSGRDFNGQVRDRSPAPHRAFRSGGQGLQYLVQLPRPDHPRRGIRGMQAQEVAAGIHGQGEPTESNALRRFRSEGVSGRPRSEEGGCDDAGTDPKHDRPQAPTPSTLDSVPNPSTTASMLDVTMRQPTPSTLWERAPSTWWSGGDGEPRCAGLVPTSASAVPRTA